MEIIGINTWFSIYIMKIFLNTYMCACVHIKSLQLCQTFWGPHRASLSMGFSRQEFWSGLPFPSPKHIHTHICVYLYIYIYLLRRPGAVSNLLPKSVSTHRSQTLVSKYFLHEKEQKLHWKTAGYKLGQEMVKGMTKWLGIYSVQKIMKYSKSHVIYQKRSQSMGHEELDTT